MVSDAPTKRPVLRGLRAAAVAGLLVLAAGCATVPPIEPTPEALAAATEKARAARDQARQADAMARRYAAQKSWRAAAGAVDRIMFALRDARRIRSAVAAANKRAQKSWRTAQGRDRTAGRHQMLFAVVETPGATGTWQSQIAEVARQTAQALSAVDGHLREVERIADSVDTIGETVAADTTADAAPPAQAYGYVAPPATTFDQDVLGARQ